MILDKAISILHFEDNKIHQKMLKDYLNREFNAKIRQESTLRNAETFLEPLCASVYDAIICDWMFPYRDAGKILVNLANCGKTVIFYTCLDREDFCLKCNDMLGYIPSNFKFIQKASSLNTLSTIGKLIENEL
jgi:DNA-binding response OmpR family regulator